MTTRWQRLASAILAAIMILSIAASALAYTTIAFGAKGDDVRKLQRALKSKGYYSGTVDGTFGQKTRSAVYRYQKAIGIEPDGKPGNTTLTALYEGTSAANVTNDKKNKVSVKNKDSLAYGMTGDKVKSLQRLLKEAGYFKGSVDGKYGNLTLRAVKRSQWAKGLRGDGIAGEKTMKALKGE